MRSLILSRTNATTTSLRLSYGSKHIQLSRRQLLNVQHNIQLNHCAYPTRNVTSLTPHPRILDKRCVRNSSITADQIIKYPDEIDDAQGSRGRRLDSSTISSDIREKVKDLTSDLRIKGHDIPRLVGIVSLNKNDESELQLSANAQRSLKYATRLASRCKEDGIDFELWKVDDPEDIESVAVEANNDETINGVVILYPIFDQPRGINPSLNNFCSLTGEYYSEDDRLRDVVSYKIDVAGLGSTYNKPSSSFLKNCISNIKNKVNQFEQPSILPCWVEAMIKVLGLPQSDLEGIIPVGQRMTGRVVTIFNADSSEVTVDPIISFMSSEGATVYAISSDNLIYECTGSNSLQQHCLSKISIEDCLRRSNVIITGVPNSVGRESNKRSNLIPTDWIQNNSTVINMSGQNDIFDDDEIIKIPEVTYVSNVDEIVLSLMEQNLLKLYEAYHQPRDSLKTDSRRKVSRANIVSAAFMALS